MKPNYVGSYVALLFDEDDMTYKLFRIDSCDGNKYNLSQLYTRRIVHLTKKELDMLGYEGKLVMF